MPVEDTNWNCVELPLAAFTSAPVDSPAFAQNVRDAFHTLQLFLNQQMPGMYLSAGDADAYGKILDQVRSQLNIPDPDDDARVGDDLDIPGAINDLLGGFGGMYQARIMDQDAHADEYYNIIPIRPAADDAGAYVDISGTDVIVARNLAEVAHSTHMLRDDDHAEAGGPGTGTGENTVLVLRRKRNDGQGYHHYFYKLPDAYIMEVPAKAQADYAEGVGGVCTVSVKLCESWVGDGEWGPAIHCDLPYRDGEYPRVFEDDIIPVQVNRRDAGGANEILVSTHMGRWDLPLGSMELWGGDFLAPPAGWMVSATFDGKFLVTGDVLGSYTSGTTGGNADHGNGTNDHSVHATHGVHDTHATHADHGAHTHTINEMQYLGSFPSKADFDTNHDGTTEEALTTYPPLHSYNPVTSSAATGLSHDAHDAHSAHDAHDAHSTTDNRPPFIVGFCVIIRTS